MCFNQEMVKQLQTWIAFFVPYLNSQRLSISYFSCWRALKMLIYVFSFKSLPATELQHSCSWLSLAKHLLMQRQQSSWSHSGRRYIISQSAHWFWVCHLLSCQISHLVLCCDIGSFQERLCFGGNGALWRGETKMKDPCYFDIVRGFMQSSLSSVS